MTDANARLPSPGQSEPRRGSRTQVLIIRLWHEPAEAETTRLRGTVQELGGAMLGAFDSIQSMVPLIERFVAKGGRVDG